jgi:UDP-glucose:(glucosyl)LPS alpha-1,2-glucosyltransferase
MNEDLIELPEIAKNANGGTEQMLRRIYDRVPRELLEQTQIIPTRIANELDPNKIRIAYIHDLPQDPSVSYLANGGWNKFHKIVFVSNWQMQAFINVYNIPWSKCVVIQNGIVPIESHEKPSDGKIRLIYTSTPHRGLGILANVFAKLCERYDNLELDVFSSFKLYGWEDRDEHFKELFKFLEQHPNIKYHGSTSNEEVREALKRANIFAYPSIWTETSCLCLIEAMSAGLMCVHPNNGALYETASNLTNMYQYDETVERHAQVFYEILSSTIETYNHDEIKSRIEVQKSYTNTFYNIDVKALQWKYLIESLLDAPREIQSSIIEFDTSMTLPRFEVS